MPLVADNSMANIAGQRLLSYKRMANTPQANIRIAVLQHKLVRHLQAAYGSVIGSNTLLSLLADAAGVFLDISDFVGQTEDTSH